jgi:hypothetical protein
VQRRLGPTGIVDGYADRADAWIRVTAARFGQLPFYAARKHLNFYLGIRHAGLQIVKLGLF